MLVAVRITTTARIISLFIFELRKAGGPGGRAHSGGSLIAVASLAGGSCLHKTAADFRGTAGAAPFGAKKPYNVGCDVQMKPWFFFITGRGFFPSRARIKGYSCESFTSEVKLRPHYPHNRTGTSC